MAVFGRRVEYPKVEDLVDRHYSKCHIIFEKVHILHNFTLTLFINEFSIFIFGAGFFVLICFVLMIFDALFFFSFYLISFSITVVLLDFFIVRYLSSA